jgi:mono/diheme cytochrome c family protein
MSKPAALTSSAICISVALTSSALAIDLANGERLAKRWCVSCHVVASDQRQGSTDAPPFTEVARTPGLNVDTLTAFLRDPHPKMPDMSLTRNESADLAAYIAAQRP